MGSFSAPESARWAGDRTDAYVHCARVRRAGSRQPAQAVAVACAFLQVDRRTERGRGRPRVDGDGDAEAHAHARLIPDPRVQCIVQQGPAAPRLLPLASSLLPTCRGRPGIAGYVADVLCINHSRAHTSFFSATLIYSSPLRFGVRGSVDQSVPRPAGFFILGIGPRPAVPSSAAYMLASTSSSRWPDSNSVRACPLAS